MNYRHIYHAGNFADVFKHIVLTQIITYLQRKPKPFRVIDTHAGTGLYNLTSLEANKTLEWQSGISRFLQTISPQTSIDKNLNIDNLETILDTKTYQLLAPYLQAISSVNRDGILRFYPGSPLFARLNFRSQDRLTAIELHQADYESLKQEFEGDYQSRILHLDGRLALKAQLPPKEKRGLVLVDPPFEKTDEFSALAKGLSEALKRFSYGVYMFWYPVKDYAKIKQFSDTIVKNSSVPILQTEFHIRKPSTTAALDGSGLIIINPPYILPDLLNQLEPLLVKAFAEDKTAHIKQTWLQRE